MYSVIRSTVHSEQKIIAECESFENACEAAINLGATGKPTKRGKNDWCFDGGTEDIGYWITEE